MLLRVGAGGGTNACDADDDDDAADAADVVDLRGSPIGRPLSLKVNSIFVAICTYRYVMTVPANSSD